MGYQGIYIGQLFMHRMYLVDQNNQTNTQYLKHLIRLINGEEHHEQIECITRILDTGSTQKDNELHNKCIQYLLQAGIYKDLSTSTM